VAEGVPEEEKRLVRERAKEISSLTLTENAREELNHIQLDEKARVSEVVGTVIALENVRLFNKVEKRIFSVFDKTVTVELEKQAMINGLDRQYIKNHLDDAVRKGIQASNKKTTDLIWGKYKESMKYEVSQSIRESMLSGRNPRQLAEELKGLVGENEYFAERLMWTEQANVQGRSQVESYKAQGIVEYDFMVEPSACKVCKEVESQNPHLVSKAQEGVNLQAMHPNCRCSTVGVPL